MKDTLKFVGASFLMLATLILVNMVFVQSLMGDYDWLNLLLTAVYTALVLAAAIYDGLNCGSRDCKFTALMEKQKAERGYQIKPEEAQRMYRPAKGITAALIASAPAIVLSVVSLFFADNAPVMLTFLTRLCLGEFLGLFQYVSGALPWLYLPLALIYPACIGVAYLFGPKLWARQVAQMEKAKREKRRKVNRRRKKKQPAA